MFKRFMPKIIGFDELEDLIDNGIIFDERSITKAISNDIAKIKI